jgi:F0F1-type ATP synthase assembly protein I
MVKTPAAPKSTPPSLPDGDSSQPKSEASSQAQDRFWVMALSLGWQLLVVFLVPIMAGYTLDKKTHHEPLFLIIGFVIAIAGFAMVLWRTAQLANEDYKETHNGGDKHA